MLAASLTPSSTLLCLQKAANLSADQLARLRPRLTYFSRGCQLYHRQLQRDLAGKTDKQLLEDQVCVCACVRVCVRVCVCVPYIHSYICSCHACLTTALVLHPQSTEKLQAKTAIDNILALIRVSLTTSLCPPPPPPHTHLHTRVFPFPPCVDRGRTFSTRPPLAPQL